MKTILLYTGTFILILAGMTFFLLKFQPPPPPMVAADSLASDSTQVDSALARRSDLAEELLKREHLIDSLQSKILEASEQNQQLSEARDKAVQAGQVKADETFEKNVKEMARIYENMDALESAKVLGSLDVRVAVSVLSKMKKRKAAQVMEALDPQIAVEISKEMAQLR